MLEIIEVGWTSTASYCKPYDPFFACIYLAESICFISPSDRGNLIILLPILYIVLGFIGGVTGAFVYNLAVSWIGGMEVEFDTDQGV